MTRNDRRVKKASCQTDVGGSISLCNNNRMSCGGKQDLGSLESLVVCALAEWKKIRAHGLTNVIIIWLIPMAILCVCCRVLPCPKSSMK